MIHIGIDVTKDKHDCFIINSDGEVLFHTFTISNNHEDFNTLFQKIGSVLDGFAKVKVGLEATRRYSYNLLGFLLDRGLLTYVINPLHTSLYRKNLALRKTRTDKVDSRIIATIIMSDMNLKSYSDTSYHNEELKPFTRYRFGKVKERTKLKTSISGLVNILLPEPEKLVPSLHLSSVYASLSEFPGAAQIATSHLAKLTNLLSQASGGCHGEETAILFHETARNSIGFVVPTKPLELKHTIKLIQELTAEIDEIEVAIKRIMDGEIHSPILTIPGINYRMGTMVLAEIGGFNRFDSADRVFTYTGMSPPTYRSGQLNNCYSHMGKRDSCHLQYALYNATKYICQQGESFSAYLTRKRSKGKYYNIALPHTTKKLVRLIFATERSGRTYQSAA